MLLRSPRTIMIRDIVEGLRSRDKQGSCTSASAGSIPSDSTSVGIINICGDDSWMSRHILGRGEDLLADDIVRGLVLGEHQRTVGSRLIIYTSLGLFHFFANATQKLVLVFIEQLPGVFVRQQRRVSFI